MGRDAPPREGNPGSLISRLRSANDRCWRIVLQKSTVAGRRIFRENPKRDALADSYDLNRITEVACEFNVWR
jgi:hypothetical protein